MAKSIWAKALFAGLSAALLALAGAPRPAAAQEGAAKALARLDRAWREDYEGRWPGFSILVARQGEVLLRAGYGFADCSTNRVNGPDTVYYIASVSKAFTAMAAMMLAEDGKLSLDDSITRHVAGLPGYARQVTLRHLIAHTGGLPDYMELAEAKGVEAETDNARIVTLLADTQRPDFHPGARYDYSNTGYALLGMAVESASGMPFADVMDKRIFKPLGMTRSFQLQPGKPPAPTQAKPYDSNSDDPCEPYAFGAAKIDYIYGDGGVMSSLDDMFLWAQAMDGTKLLSARGMEQVFTSSVLNDGSATGYGAGWEVEGRGDRATQSHSGYWDGWNSYLLRQPGQGIIVIMLSNDDAFDYEVTLEQVMEALKAARKKQ